MVIARTFPNVNAQAPEASAGQEPGGELLPNLGLLIGVVVALVTAATQTRLVGRAVGDLFGGDFLNVACFGLVGAVVISALLVRSAPSARGRCWVGLALSLTPLALLTYYLSTTDG